MIYFGYTSYSFNSFDEFEVRLPESSHNDYYVWNHVIPPLIAMNQDKYRIAPVDVLLERGTSFIFPIELHASFTEWFEKRLMDSFLDVHIPEKVLNAVRSGQAKILAMYNEARTFEYRGPDGGKCFIYDDFLKFTERHRIPSGALWINTENVAFHDEYVSWKILRNITRLSQAPFEVRYGDLNLYFMQSIRKLNIRGQNMIMSNEFKKMEHGFLHTRQRVEIVKLKETVRDFIIRADEIFETTNPEKLFLCMNNTYRFHRLSLVVFLELYGYINNSIVSFNMQNPDSIIFNNEVWQSTWENIKQKLPMKIDDVNLFDNDAHYEPGSALSCDSAGIGIQDDTPYRNVFLNIVTETLADYGDCEFITEKTWKAVVSCKPFVVLGKPHTLKHLRKLGFKTFSPYIDESYDECESYPERFVKLCNSVAQIGNMSNEQRDELRKHVVPIIRHNLSVLATTVPNLERTIYEMADGFYRT